jgi:hypothetical protein
MGNQFSEQGRKKIAYEKYKLWSSSLLPEAPFWGGVKTFFSRPYS